MFNLIDGRVHGTEPEESEDDIFSATAHDVEEVFLGNLFNVCMEGISVVDCTSFIHSLVHIANSNWGGEFFGGKSMFPDKLSVNARDICTRVYQCGGVDDFESV